MKKLALALAVVIASPVLVIASEAILSRASAGESDLAQERVVLDLVVDTERMGEEPTSQEQRALLESAEKTLLARLPKVKIYPAASSEAADQYLRLRAHENHGYTRERLIRLATATGDLAFQVVMEASDLAGEDTSLVQQRDLFDEWRKKHPKAPIAEFASVPLEKGGPDPSVRWVWSPKQDDASPLEPMPVLRQVEENWRFGVSDVESFHATVDNRSHPAMGFRLHKNRQPAFKEFTAAIKGRQLAVIVGDRVLTAPTVNEPLPGIGIITGGALGFAEEEVSDLVAILSHPLLDVMLKVKGKGGK